MDFKKYKNKIKRQIKNRHSLPVAALFFATFIFFILPPYFNQEEIPPFVLGVDTDKKIVLADAESVPQGKFSIHSSLFDVLAGSLTSVYNSLNPHIKYVYVEPGLRKEEIAELFGKTLEWSDEEMEKFISHKSLLWGDMEGYYHPGTYIVRKKEKSSSVIGKMTDSFRDEVVSRYPIEVAQVVDMKTALILASLIEKEANGTTDMRLISGIIWNRIFADMTLDIDATLQYAKGEPGNWRPPVRPKDKDIDSPYNTYKNKGLPPGPISNPSLAAIAAALNPEKTDCLFYLHDTKRRIYCSVTYEEHKRNISTHY